MLVEHSKPASKKNIKQKNACEPVAVEVCSSRSSMAVILMGDLRSERMVFRAAADKGMETTGATFSWSSSTSTTIAGATTLTFSSWVIGTRSGGGNTEERRVDLRVKTVDEIDGLKASIPTPSAAARLRVIGIFQIKLVD